MKLLILEIVRGEIFKCQVKQFHETGDSSTNIKSSNQQQQQQQLLKKNSKYG